MARRKRASMREGPLADLFRFVDLAALHKDRKVPERLSLASQRAQLPEEVCVASCVGGGVCVCAQRGGM